MTVPVEVINRAIGKVFETMYFCEASYCGRGRVPEPRIETSIDFTGSISGVFYLEVSSRLAARLAADFLAADPLELRSEYIDATVTELANVSCGATIAAWRPFFNVHFSIPHASDSRDGEEFAYCFSVNGENPGIAIDIAVSGSPE